MPVLLLPAANCQLQPLLPHFCKLRMGDVPDPDKSRALHAAAASRHTAERALRTRLPGDPCPVQLVLPCCLLPGCWDALQQLRIANRPHRGTGAGRQRRIWASNHCQQEHAAPFQCEANMQLL